MDTSSGRDAVAIVGVGNTDYGRDYRERGVARDPVDLAVTALERALDDSGLTARDIDGIAISPMIPASRGLTGAVLARRVGIENPWITDSVQLDNLTAAITSGECSTIALVYGSAQRSQAINYGGPHGRTSYLSYYYFHPWGFSSQAAHWALMFRRHQLQYGSTEEQLGAVAVALRKHAALNPDAVMREPMSLETYLATRYVCRPLRLVDLCIVNDGGVAIILRRADMARNLKQPPVLVSGFAAGHARHDVAQLRPLVLDLQHEILSAAASRALSMAGATTRDVDHFQAYDAASVNLPMALEGAGFCMRGDGLEFVQDGRIELGGELPCNTSGGLLSEAYMHGQNHTVEAVRQLRHAAGDRQVDGVETSMYVGFTTSTATAVVYRRGT